MKRVLLSLLLHQNKFGYNTAIRLIKQILIKQSYDEEKLPSNIPKLTLVYREHGFGKSQAIQWWADKNDAVYVRATQGMTSRWLPKSQKN